MTAITAGMASGVVLSAFDTPLTQIRRRQLAADAVADLRASGGEVLIDVGTHGACLAGSDRFDVYDTWDLWPGNRGDLTGGRLVEHAERAIQAQRALGVRPIAPTVVIDDPLSRAATQAIALLEASLATDAETSAYLVGTPALWRSGGRLDDLIGQIAQLGSGRVYVSTLRPNLDYPISGLTQDEVAGICRSVHSLSLRAQTTLLQSDLFGLPALAAGARSIGSGWYLRQRLMAPDAFRLNTGTRRNSSRITHSGLLAVLKRPEAELLLASNGALSNQLVPGPLPADPILWRHHLATVAALARRITRHADRRDRVHELRDMYADAATQFGRVRTAIGRMEFDEARWINQVRLGLGIYATAEGF